MATDRKIGNHNVATTGMLQISEDYARLQSIVENGNFTIIQTRETELSTMYNNLYEKIHRDLDDALAETPEWAIRARNHFQDIINEIESDHRRRRQNPKYMQKFLDSYKDVCYYRR